MIMTPYLIGAAFLVAGPAIIFLSNNLSKQVINGPYYSHNDWSTIFDHSVAVYF